MIYTLTNQRGISLKVTSFGGRIMELWVPGRDGVADDIVLGAKEESRYEDYGSGERFLGAAIGRFANRIAGGRFTLDGKEYRLPLNEATNSLHGGRKGFDMVYWKVEEVRSDRIVFSYVSPDGEEGYPGTLRVRMTYMLTEDSLVIDYSAVTDAPTVVNLTHHSFFNLHGEGKGSVNDHILRINARFFTPVDENLAPTGEIAPVEGTPFDFTHATQIGLRLGEKDEQLRIGRGYDHNWVLSKPYEGALTEAAVVEDPVSGRRMEVWTTEPGLQFYGGNYFDGGMKGKNGLPYGKHCAFALETQHFPDSPNRPEFPSTVLRPGKTYRQTCIYKFTRV